MLPITKARNTYQRVELKELLALPADALDLCAGNRGMGSGEKVAWTHGRDAHGYTCIKLGRMLR